MTPLWLIIHHTATDRDTTTFSGVKDYHISKGWGDIGYHWFITTNRAYQGRGENVVGAHCLADGMNFKSLGICLTGNFQNETPTQWQLQRLEKLVRELQIKYNINSDHILAHGEVNGSSTACCGNNLIPFVKKLRGGSMSNDYKGLDLTNEDSMKVAVDTWDEVVNQKLYVKKDKYEKLSQDYNKLKDSTEARIKAETDNREELATMLAIDNDWPKILENVGELLAAKENKKVEVVETGHSKICRMLAKVGL